MTPLETGRLWARWLRAWKEALDAKRPMSRWDWGLRNLSLQRAGRQLKLFKESKNG